MRTSTISPKQANRPGKARRAVTTLVVAALWLLIWEALYRLVGADVLLASPLQVGRRLVQLVGQGEFWRITLTSLGRVLMSYALGVAVGAALAVLTFNLPWLRAFLSPMLAIVRAMPVASFIILALVWLTSRRVPVLTGFLMVLPIVWGNVETGIRAADPELLEMAAVFGMTRRQKLMGIYAPAVLPYFVTACTMSLGLCWKASIAAEVLGSPKFSIGAQLYNAKIYLETADLFAWTVVVVVLSMALEKLFAALMARVKRRVPYE